MCRIACYLGPPITLQALLVDPPHALYNQAWEPEHQVSGTVNADGFGVGWYAPQHRTEPAVHRTSRPVWADRSFASIAGVVESSAVLAVVRGATAPAPIEDSGTQPFSGGPWLFAHNGAVDDFRTGAAAVLRRQLTPEQESAILGATDSEVLFALARAAVAAGHSADEALVEVVAAVEKVSGGRLNMVLTDGARAAATCVGDSLYTRFGAGTVVVASEPFDDDPDWKAVPDRSVILARSGALEVRPLP